MLDPLLVKNLMLKKGNYLYKGVKYFYTKEQE